MVSLPDLAAASSLLSSRWSRDNLVTSHPGRLYDGRALEAIDQETLEYLVNELAEREGPLEVGTAHQGVLSWSVHLEAPNGALVLQVPRELDEPGPRGRTKRDLPRLCHDSLAHFHARGLGRFVVTPKALLTLGGHVPAVLLEVPDDHYPLIFGGGRLRVEVADPQAPWLLGLGPARTADLLAEMIGALAYLYDPELDGGTAVTDVLVNDGDFAVGRTEGGDFALKLTTVRRREGGIGPSLLLLYFIQLMTFEDFAVDGGVTGLPVSIGNPSIAFTGLVRGFCHRARDLGSTEEQGAELARRVIGDFARSREGRAYRPWADRFLAGRLPHSFGADPREHWWRTFPLQKRYRVLELRGRQDPTGPAAAAARAVKTVLDRLARDIGRLPQEEPGALAINDLDRAGLLALVAEAQVEPEARPRLADELVAHWPHRSLERLLAEVPGARGLRRMKSRLSFGQNVAGADFATLKSLGPPPKAGLSAHPIANPEIFSMLPLPEAEHARAAATFPSFESYMDGALHHPAWGYYGHGVVIGRNDAHFSTHPEDLSPRYGSWIAHVAFRAWCELVAHGELGATEPFAVVEFGAGNGRLARDFVDGARARARAARGEDAERWRTFLARLRYHIYETSAALREKQGALLGPDAVVAEGDARRPAETLRRDFPDGLTGFVVTNELPDAFGVHKVVLEPNGGARLALVVPRVEATLLAALSPALAGRVSDCDTALRETFGIGANPGDQYLDARTYETMMTELAELPGERREALLGELWFEEAYVDVAHCPELATHLRDNGDEYRLALLREPSAVVAYVNVHAGRFIRELGSALRAGHIVTIDYGDTTEGLVTGARRGDFSFRVYGDWQDYVPRPNDPYAAPGTQDMTADVNFTDLARAGRDVGLEVVHFGFERDLVGAELGGLLYEEDEVVARFLGNPAFKVLVLGKRPSDLLVGNLSTPLELVARRR